MGELFVGYDPNLQRRVVAKFIRADALSENSRARFRTEAATLARLEHPNVARVFGYVEGEDPHLVMEFVDGGTLAEWIRSGPLSPLEAATLLEGVARGVAAAHASLVIHRDLKPSNILLNHGSDSLPKVTDFGMAKDVDALESLTATNAVLGTPEYMSPEQANPKRGECDARSDVWGLAATLYAAVTGYPPFTRDLHRPPVLTQQLVPPQSHMPSLPSELSAIILKGLEKHPDDRYQSAAEFADDLKRFVDGQPIEARRRAWPIRAWRRVCTVSKSAVTVTLALLLAGVSLSMMVLRERSVGDRIDTASERQVQWLLEGLENGRPATFLGEKGTPPFRRAVGGLHAAESREITEGALAIEAGTSTYCQLTPELPIDRYDVQVQICEVSGTRADAMPWLGLIVGLTETNLLEGGVIRSGFAVRYCDSTNFPGGPIEPTRARFEHFIHRERPNVVEDAGTYYKAASPPFLPSRQGGWPIGKWRPLRFRVTPEELVAYWTDGERQEKPFVEFKADKLNAIIREHAQDFKTELPAWSPRRPIAVICTRAVIGVRNLVVTPRR